MTKQKQVAEPQGEIATKQVKEPTTIKSVKVADVVIEQSPLRKGDQFLFVKDGEEVYYTRSVANVIFQRNSAVMEIPKCSEYIPPKGSKCKNCG